MGQREYIILLPHKWPLGLPPGLEKKKKNPSVLVKAFLFSFLPFHFLIFLINLETNHTKEFQYQRYYKNMLPNTFFHYEYSKDVFLTHFLNHSFHIILKTKTTILLPNVP